MSDLDLDAIEKEFDHYWPKLAWPDRILALVKRCREAEEEVKRLSYCHDDIEGSLKDRLKVTHHWRKKWKEAEARIAGLEAALKRHAEDGCSTCRALLRREQ
ncbi:MAG: hypothetical protein ACE5M4_09110 [Anaerolineales bacterium]